MANVKQLAEAALNEGAGILRLAPNWVPRSFLQPGKRIKLHPADYYALGTHRGGIDERWFGSTTPATNEGAPPDEGLSYVVLGKERFTHATRSPNWEPRSSATRSGTPIIAGPCIRSSSTTWGRSRI